MLTTLHRPGLAYVKCGVILADLSPEHETQAGLFNRPDTDSPTRLMQAIDQINGDLGRGTLVYGGSGLSPSWAAVANLESPHYTTNWRAVLRVQA